MAITFSRAETKFFQPQKLHHFLNREASDSHDFRGEEVLFDGAVAESLPLPF
jgi:hypothetical protein